MKQFSPACCTYHIGILGLLLSILCNNNLSAQGLPEMNIVPLQAGMLSKEVTERLGTPDQTIADSNAESERWLYGKSIVFFANGRVSAWSNNGELDRKYEQQFFGAASKPKYRYFYEIGWANAYSPNRTALLDQVINRIK